MKNQQNNSKITLIIVAAVLVAVIALAAVLYNTLDIGSKPGLVPMNNGEGEEEGSSGITETDENAELPEEVPEEEEIPLAPDFTVEDLDGNKYKLSDFRGKPVIVNFWASWCGPCKMEMPDFEELYKEYGDNINFLMVNMTDGNQETKDKAYKHITSSGYTFPVYYDTEMEAAYAYGVSSIPATYFIDSEGYPVVYGVGALDKETLLTGIEMFPEFK